jgi:hypothetical protein
LLNRKIGIIILLGVLWGLSFYCTFRYLQPFQKLKIKERELRIKPNVRVDPSHKYRITLWDYDWPLEKGNYRQYLQKQIAAFNRSYPNITVKMRLLDLLTGPAELANALRQGKPPDVYCSNFVTPGFDFKYQVPVGPFLKPQIWQERYFPAMVRMVEINGVQCWFPRWARPGLWVGNRQLLENAGLEIANVQVRGWSWEDVLGLRARLPQKNHLMVGNLLPEAVLQTIGSQPGLTDATSAAWELLQKIHDAKGVPTDGNLRMLEYFCSGQAALLAGVNPVIWRYLRERLACLGVSWETVALPAPAWPRGKTVRPVELGVIGIYRQPHLGGYEQVAAALKLGEYLSRCFGDQRPWTELMLIPTARVAAVEWAKQGDTGRKVLKLLGPELVSGNWRLPLPDQVKLGRVSTVVQKYLAGNLSQTAVMRQLQMESRGE